MQQQPPVKKSRHIGHWILAIVGLLEIAIIAGIVLFVRSGSCAAVAAPGGFGRIGGSAATAEPSGSGSAPTPLPTQPAAATDTAPPSTGATPQAANASGDLNQVPDPNCVGKAAAGVLNSGESTTPPSCPPMSSPTP